MKKNDAEWNKAYNEGADAFLNGKPLQVPREYFTGKDHAERTRCLVIAKAWQRGWVEQSLDEVA